MGWRMMKMREGQGGSKAKELTKEMMEAFEELEEIFEELCEAVEEEDSPNSKVGDNSRSGSYGAGYRERSGGYGERSGGYGERRRRRG